MRDNKHFKEFFLFHEESLKTGLKRLDRDAGYYSEKFAKLFMKHLQESNDFRKYNREVFENLKQKESNKKSIE